MDDPMKGFSDRLRKLRNARGLTQTDLAQRTNISQKAISHYEQDIRQNIRALNLIKLADALGVSVDCLLGREDDGQ